MTSFLAIQTGNSLEFAKTWTEFAGRLFSSTAMLMLRSNHSDGRDVPTSQQDLCP